MELEEQPEQTPMAPDTAPVDTDMAIKFLRCVQTAVLQCCSAAQSAGGV